MFDFLKVDVEGAEPDVLLNGDWQSYRPRVIVVEALAPYTLAPAWEAWEPFLGKHGYRYVMFDSLNRYYLAEEASELMPCFATAPAAFDSFQFRNVKTGARRRGGTLDHRLASLGLALFKTSELPLIDRDFLFELITAEISISALESAAGKDDIAKAIERLFGPDAGPSAEELNLPPAARLSEIYAALLDRDQFRAACGRISASYAW